MSSFELKYIDIKSSFYKEATSIREQLFFQNMDNSSDLINDIFESKAIHLVCLNNNKVIATGRLNIENEVGIISQMATKEGYQRKGIGAKILKALIHKSKENQVDKIELSARETAFRFYKKFDFFGVGNKYPSKKTGIIHQKMVLKIK